MKAVDRRNLPAAGPALLKAVALALPLLLGGCDPKSPKVTQDMPPSPDVVQGSGSVTSATGTATGTGAAGTEAASVPPAGTLPPAGASPPR